MRKECDAEAQRDHLLGRVDVVELHHAPRRDSGLEEHRVRQLVVARRAVEENELLVGEVGEAHDVARRVRRVHDEHELVLVERELLDVGIVEGAEQPDGDLVALDELDHLLGVAGAHRDLNARVRLGEPFEDRGQRVGRDDRRRADRDVAGGAARELGQDRPRLGDRLQRPFGVGEEGAPGLGHAHAASPADEERRAHRPFERIQAGRQRRLRHVESSGCAGDRPAADDLDERLELGMHRQILSR